MAAGAAEIKRERQEEEKDHNKNNIICIMIDGGEGAEPPIESSKDGGEGLRSGRAEPPFMPSSSNSVCKDYF